MKIKKRMLSIIVVLVMLMSLLAGCGKEETPINVTEAPAETSIPATEAAEEVIKLALKEL